MEMIAFQQRQVKPMMWLSFSVSALNFHHRTVEFGFSLTFITDCELKNVFIGNKISGEGAILLELK